jgi:hypothetical protein
MTKNRIYGRSTLEPDVVARWRLDSRAREIPRPDRITSLCHSHARHEQGPACTSTSCVCVSMDPYITLCPPALCVETIHRSHSCIFSGGQPAGRPAIRPIMHSLSIGNLFFPPLRSLLSPFFSNSKQHLACSLCPVEQYSAPTYILGTS